MIVMELSGVHIGAKAKVTYRFKSWKSDRPAVDVTGYLGKIEHMPGGEAWVTIVQHPDSVAMARYHKAIRLPFDGEVELIN